MVLYYNKIASLPASFGKEMRALKELKIGDNQLTSLDDDFTNHFENLEHLDLSNNDLNALPENFGKGMTLLKSLSLGGNHLESLLNDFGTDMIELESLRLDSNGLVYLPLDFGRGMDNLVKLHLDRNKLKYLPVGFWTNLSSLKYVNFNRNYFDDEYLKFETFTLPQNIEIFRGEQGNEESYIAKDDFIEMIRKILIPKSEDDLNDIPTLTVDKFNNVYTFENNLNENPKDNIVICTQKSHGSCDGCQIEEYIVAIASKIPDEGVKESFANGFKEKKLVDAEFLQNLNTKSLKTRSSEITGTNVYRLTKMMRV